MQDVVLAGGFEAGLYHSIGIGYLAIVHKAERAWWTWRGRGAEIQPKRCFLMFYLLLCKLHQIESITYSMLLLVLSVTSLYKL